MKKFVMLTWAVSGIGGGQYYTLNRAKFYTNHGYESFICHMHGGEVLISDFEKYPHLLVKELKQPVGSYTMNHVGRVLDVIRKFIHYSSADEVLIESDGLEQATWAEMLASATKGKHFYYILGENDRVNDPQLVPFVKYKMDRKEVAGITDSSLSLLLSRWCKVENSADYHIDAPVVTDIVDYKCPALESLSHVDYTIGVMSRLKKSFVEPTLQAISRFISLNSSYSFRVIVVGDSADQSLKQRLASIFDENENCSVLMTGFLTPIPQKYVEICDVCVSSSGCASVTKRAGVITVAIDANDNYPIGVLNYTTNSTIYRTEEPVIPLETYLHEILIEKKYPSHYTPISSNNTLDSLLKDMSDYIEQSDMSKEYYDLSSTFSMKNKLIGLKYRAKERTTYIFGASFANKLHDIHKSIKRR